MIGGMGSCVGWGVMCVVKQQHSATVSINVLH